jgi:drug/metabolite transporter (DMT)-like permease
MSQISSTPSNGAVVGPVLMLLASLVLAGSNIPQSLLPTPEQYGGFGMSSTGMAFWQYLIATVFVVPLIMRIGLKNLRTRHPFAHEVRAFVSALGVHVFVYGFATGMPIWQLVTLLATGPLFIALGSMVFLRERVTAIRIIASLVAFGGAILASQLGTDGFSPTILIPIVAAALWATTDILTKYLSREESPDTLTVSLLVLITPNHLAILLISTVWAALFPALTPAGLSTGFPFALPTGNGLWILLLLGVLTAIAQYLLAAAYKRADAAYLQPFGDLKVPLSALLGWYFLNQVPGQWFWVGTALIIAASLLIFFAEAGNRRQGGLAAA